MSVLAEIIAGVREDLATRRFPLAQIQELMLHAPEVIKPKFSKSNFGVIAEVKRSSPSKGDLAPIPNPADLASRYEENGAMAISVLTEGRRFKGSIEDLVQVRNVVKIPILRKDFMVDEYQFYEARAHGADLVLLIVAGISKSQLKDYYALTKELGMTAIVEIHDLLELDSAMEIEPEVIGVNSRNLKTLEVSNDIFVELLPRIPNTIIKIAESGIASQEDAAFAREYGADVILVGEALVKNNGDIKSLIGSIE